MPEITKDDDDSGFIGLIVVFARLKEATPKTIIIVPAIAKVSAKNSRPRNTKLKPGTSRETSHMSAASNAPTAKGGTFNSRTRMATA